MKLMGNLKKKIENVNASEDSKEQFMDAVKGEGVILDDEDLDNASGGEAFTGYYDRSNTRR